ncbi:MAG: hypothetical protein ACK5GN_02830 [Pseudomonadota bacterium]
MPVKLARLLLDITIGCCFDSHPRIDSVLQNSGFRFGLLENAMYRLNYYAAAKNFLECYRRIA